MNTQAPESSDDDEAAWATSSQEPQLSDLQGSKSVITGLGKIGEGSLQTIYGISRLSVSILVFLTRQTCHRVVQEVSPQISQTPSKETRWDQETAAAKERFREQDVSEEDIEQAIEWTRSE